MTRQVPRVVIALLLVVSLLNATTLVYADETQSQTEDFATEASPEAMLADLFFLRPLGFVALMFGTVAWVLALPFTLPTDSEMKAAQKLVVDPAKYTFNRPLGQN
jgi:hypothetical protein